MSDPAEAELAKASFEMNRLVERLRARLTGADRDLFDELWDATLRERSALGKAWNVRMKALVDTVRPG